MTWFGVEFGIFECEAAFLFQGSRCPSDQREWALRPWCGSPQPVRQPLDRRDHFHTPGAFWFCTRPACSDFPSCRRGIANRAGRAGSSRAAGTGGQPHEGDGPDLTLPGRCGSCGRRHDGKSERQPQQRGAPTNKAAKATTGHSPRPAAGRGAPSRREALSGGAAGGPALHQAFDFQDRHHGCGRGLPPRPGCGRSRPQRPAGAGKQWPAAASGRALSCAPAPAPEGHSQDQSQGPGEERASGGSSGVGLSPGRGAPSCWQAAARVLRSPQLLCLSARLAAGVAVWASRRIVAPTGIAPAGRGQVGPVTLCSSAGGSPGPT